MASSIANVGLSKRAALAAVTCDNGDIESRSLEAGARVTGVEGATEDDDGLSEEEAGRVGVEVEVVVVVGVVGISLILRLEREADSRIEGVSKDSRAFGSCNCIGLPIDGL